MELTEHIALYLRAHGLQAASGALPAQPDEVWNFGRGDGLEKCLLAANILGGEAIVVDGGKATLVGADGTETCSFATAKRPRDRVWRLKEAAR